MSEKTYVCINDYAGVRRFCAGLAAQEDKQKTSSLNQLAQLVLDDRRRLGWTQADLSTMTGVSLVTISLIESGQPPSPATVRILKAMGRDAIIARYQLYDNKELITLYYSEPSGKVARPPERKRKMGRPPLSPQERLSRAHSWPTIYQMMRDSKLKGIACFKYQQELFNKSNEARQRLGRPLLSQRIELPEEFRR